jgi:hypothetical protein
MQLHLSRTALISGLFACLPCTAPSHADLLHGIGTLGDSLTDEYQFYTSDPGPRDNNRSWVETLADLRHLNFGSFTLADRGSPRFQGYAYNWARTRSTAATTFFLPPDSDFKTLIDLNQHTGLAEQITSGEVTLGWISIGSNDFLGAFLDRPTTPADVHAFLTPMINNLDLALDTALAADPNVKFVLATQTDLNHTPLVQESQAAWIELAVALGLPRPLAQNQADALSTAVTDVTKQFNDHIKQRADDDPRLALADVHQLLEDVFAAPEVTIDGITIDRFTPSTDGDPRHLWLPDGLHPSSIAGGEIANLFINAINSRFATNVTPLSDPEIVDYAYAIYNTGQIPEPCTLTLLTCIGSALASARSRPQ